MIEVDDQLSALSRLTRRPTHLEANSGYIEVSEFAIGILMGFDPLCYCNTANRCLQPALEDPYVENIPFWLSWFTGVGANVQMIGASQLLYNQWFRCWTLERPFDSFKAESGFELTL